MQLAERTPGGVEALERLVDVVGQQPAGDRADGQLRVLLVDARLDGRRSVGRSRVDEPQREPGRPLEARREASTGEPRRDAGAWSPPRSSRGPRRARRGTGRTRRRCAAGAGGGAPGEQPRQGRRRWLVGAACRPASMRDRIARCGSSPSSVSRSPRSVPVSRSATPPRRLAAASRPLGPPRRPGPGPARSPAMLLLEPRPDLRPERAVRPRRPAAGRARRSTTRRRLGRPAAALEIDRPERPARRVRRRPAAELPVAPQRHPGLASTA